MAKKEKKQKKESRRERRRLRKLEERSDQRTAEFLSQRLDAIRTDLGDLIPDLQTFEHYAEIQLVTFCVRVLGGVRKKYQKRADGQLWEEED